MKRLLSPLAAITAALLLPAAAPAQDAEELFSQHCATCHVQQASEELPSRENLAAMSPNAVLRSMTDGPMRIQAIPLSPEQRVAVAEHLTGRPVIDHPVRFDTGMCASLEGLAADNPAARWSGWGNDVRNSRYREDSEISPESVNRLELAWAFGIPGAEQARSQPAIHGGRLFMGSQNGTIYALDAETGCTYWSFRAAAEVRSAISVADIDRDGGTRTAVFFNDRQAFTYALDAETGEQLWSVKVDEHPGAMGTGSLTLHDGVLYVPTTGLSEEAVAHGENDYQCCSFRGSITALDAASGERIWKTYMLPEPRFVRTLSNGKELWGPAGVGVWSAPTVDAQRRRLYVATGNAYAEPPTETSNAVLALDLDSGEMLWVNQVLKEDIWSAGCDPSLGGRPGNPGCPEVVGPDFDFSASPVLTTAANGKDVIIATQKSGLGFAFDPDNDGKLLWDYRWGQGAAAGGVYGATSDGRLAYFAVADNWTDKPGGLHGVDLLSGERVWYTPPQPLACDSDTPNCAANQSAALSAVPGLVFSGSADGALRAYDVKSGEVRWLFNTNREFETVNGVAANGGSMDGAGAVIVGDMLYLTAGNGGFFGTPGNVLLAFKLREE